MEAVIVVGKDQIINRKDNVNLVEFWPQKVHNYTTGAVI